MEEREGGIKEMEGKEREGWNKRGEIGTLKIAFWNVAGLRNKDEDFWKGLIGWDVVVMMETWVEEKGWERVKGKLPRDFIWRCSSREGRIGKEGRWEEW